MFAAEGATVFGCDNDSDAAAETVELVEKADGVMRSLAPVDLSTEAGAREWIDAGIAAFGGIDILYNNASALRNGPFETVPPRTGTSPSRTSSTSRTSVRRRPGRT
ncbi:SDR family oxidoreductase [Streptomyces sp. NBC_00996]|nr:SDR family oxidoreductase [Streptomyces sp. NBC_00996]